MGKAWCRTQLGSISGQHVQQLEVILKGGKYEDELCYIRILRPSLNCLGTSFQQNWIFGFDTEKKIQGDPLWKLGFIKRP